MNKKHTPGPWKTYIRGKLVSVDDNNNRPVVAWPGFDGNEQPLTEKRANARLIAAAPDLLAALRELTSAVTASAAAEVVDYSALERAWDAIDKATGKEARE